MEREVAPLPRLGPRVCLAIAMLVLGAMAYDALDVRAECNPAGVPPTLDEAVTAARQIVIGDVIEVHRGKEWDPVTGRSSGFRLRVRTVVRGIAQPVMAVDDITIRPCVGLIVVQQGDRIALMLDADESSDPLSQPGSTMRPARFNAVAWIAGQPRAGVAFERVTEEQIRSMAGVAAAPEEAPPSGPPTVPILVLVAVAAIAMAAALVLWRRRGI